MSDIVVDSSTGVPATNTLVTTSTEILTVVSNNTESVVQESTTTSVSAEQTYNVVVNVDSVSTIIAGQPGPPGPAGSGGEEEMAYAKQTDFVTDNLIYRGEAAVGSATSASAWRIRKLIIGNDGDVSETWADGNANFDNVWDDRLSLTYS